MINNRTTRLRCAFIAVTMTVMSLAGCNQHEATDTAKAASPDEEPVRYVKVEQRSLPDTLDIAAKIQADPTKVVRIFPPASGRVISLSVKPGDFVHRGQTVAVLNSSDVASARSDYAKAKIEAGRAGRVMDRQKLLFEHGAGAEKDFIDARAQAEAANAELARARQRLDLLNVPVTANVDTVPLVAPANGVVLDVGAAAGEFSKSLESANQLITIADLSNVWVVGDVYEKDLAKLERGKKVLVTLQAYPDQQWKSRIDSLSGSLDPATRTLKVRVTLANPGQKLKPEMFGTIHMSAGSHMALIVPVGAIIHEGNTTTVFVNKAGKREQRTVTVGQSVDGSVEIISGLSVGDEVAAAGAELLKGLSD